MGKTPKEYAKELVDEMYGTTPPRDDNFLLKQDWELSKEHAIIAVERIISAIDWHEFEAPNKQIEYFEQVKTEIKNYERN